MKDKILHLNENKRERKGNFRIKPFDFLNIELCLDIDKQFQRELYYDVKYEVEELNVAKSILKYGFTVIDLGSHVGLWTCLLSRLVGPEGKVIAIEGHPENYNNLLYNIGLNKCTNVDCWNMVLGSDKNPPIMYMDLTNDAASGTVSNLDWMASKIGKMNNLNRKLTDDEMQSFIGDKYTAMESVSAEFNNWFESNYSNIEKIHFMKIDIEGAEKNIDFSSILREKKVKFIQYETDFHLDLSIPLIKDLKNLGYFPFKITSQGITQIEWHEETSRNSLFILPEQG